MHFLGFSARSACIAAVLLVLGACRSDVASHVESSPPGALRDSGATEPSAPEPPLPQPVPELGFVPSDADRAALGTGFTGATDAPAGSGFERGLGLGGVQADGALAAAGIRDGDVLLEMAGVRFLGTDDDPIGTLRAELERLRPEQVIAVTFARSGGPPQTADVTLGRAPPRFDTLDTPAAWLERLPGETPHTRLIDLALALPEGRADYDDTWERNRKALHRTDGLRLRRTVAAHLNLGHQESLADDMVDRMRFGPHEAALVAADLGSDIDISSIDIPGRIWREPVPGASVEELTDVIAVIVGELHDDALTQIADWDEEERAFLVEHWSGIGDRLAERDYIGSDTDLGRQRANRRVLALLARVDRAAVARLATHTQKFVDAFTPALVAAAQRHVKPGLIASRDTPAGRIEIWGRGHQDHKTRCAFRFDLEGNDHYFDVGGAADPLHPISIQIDVVGDDLYGATAPLRQGAALGGIGVLVDLAGDDQYLGSRWCQGVGIGGYGALIDSAGADIYRMQEFGQGLGLAGAGVLLDASGDDTYAGSLFCQGVGMPGGVGVLRDVRGADSYACTALYQSEYGEDGVFSGWGQGCGFGFRGMASGGIGVLHDGRGDDRYEAGNFSQGGGYFYAWGVLRDDEGDDRYIGSRYAQGFAAHEASGTFIDRAGNDVYASHATVAQGLSWDETCVVFHDHSGNDDYRTRAGFSLGAAAHNGMVLFCDGGGDDTYPGIPGRANPNTYHGGHSFALFVDLGGVDRYAQSKPETWNDRLTVRQDRAYIVDLPRAEFDDWESLRRPAETDKSDDE